MLRCEHVQFPDLWIERPRYALKLTRPDGREQTYGYDALSPLTLETALLNRIADLYELEFLDYEHWDHSIPVEVVRKWDDQTQLYKTDLRSIRDAIANEIKTTSKYNNYVYTTTYNNKQTSPEEQDRTSET